MDRHPLDVRDDHAVAAEQPVQGRQRVVAEVLVVDRVELALGDHVAHVRRLEDRHAIVGQQQLEAADEAVEVGNVGEHVVGVHHRGALALGAQTPSHLVAEELGDRRDASLLDGHLRDVHRGLDAQHLHPGALVELQEVAVVAGHLDDERRRAEAALGHHALHEAPRVLEHRVGVRREIDVLAKQPLRRNGVGDLHERALLAERELERKHRVRLREPSLGHQRVREGRGPQVEHRPELRAPARPAPQTSSFTHRRSRHFQLFQGALPLAQSPLRCVYSRSVSMGCQKPWCS